MTAVNKTNKIKIETTEVRKTQLENIPGSFQLDT
jgi:hypothetical protein